MLETAPDGILLVDKPQGISSHRVVAIARRRLGLKKVGHAGTLDPMATGLLVLGIGPSTRLLTHLVGLDKTYTATIRLGVSTDSDDADGAPTAAAGVATADVSDDAIERAVALQRGVIDQVPSTVSAIKVGGRRAYDLARKGESVELTSRTVTISQFDVAGRTDHTVEVAGTGVTVVDIEVVVTCSSGTYVRALARDVGATLGTGAHLVALRRTRVGPFDVQHAIDLEDDAVDVRAALARPADIARRLFSSVTLDAAAAKDLTDGKRVAAQHPDSDEPVAAVAADDDRLVGLVSVRRGLLRVMTNFPPPGASASSQTGPRP
ncbi:tRNA pseudouridine(55) synthase TruB [Curtobacterium sp. VKM Ac-1376]|uniref:tRNA pseudouridine(55) synthase TruB n=1 Tax=Curtobacterium sp. VKM Ac-1376 TaxID=123312 RepID=UPI00188B5A71|nr:tRNA pseudouridine(55) synthase TruB [Curtobacterium sp. VKM Ac-1376]MBF4614559.1 tRNA pseudouridine(55) synthase TruB [Curtobacterium sp. VKM Ac-1376]